MPLTVSVRLKPSGAAIVPPAPMTSRASSVDSLITRVSPGATVRVRRPAPPCPEAVAACAGAAVAKIAGVASEAAATSRARGLDRRLNWRAMSADIDAGGSGSTAGSSSWCTELSFGR
jgi:hypothetical protein